MSNPAPELPPHLSDTEPVSPDELAMLTESITTDADERAVTDAEVAAQLVDTMRALPPEEGGFRITDAALAEWALAHIVNIDREVDVFTEQRKEWEARIGLWFAQATRAHLARRAFFVHHLTGYAAEYRAEDPKHHKTLVLPSGAIKSTETKPKVVVAADKDAEDELIGWLGEHVPGDLYDTVVRTTEKVLLLELRKLCKVETMTRHELDKLLAYTYDEVAEGDEPVLPERTPEEAAQLVDVVVYEGPDATGETVRRVVDRGAEASELELSFTVAPAKRLDQ